MKPLHVDELPSFVKRFGDFLDAEIRSIDIISPTQIKLTLACQDSSRAYDWIALEFEFSAVSDASLIENSKLLHVDTSDGISISHKNDDFIFKVNNSTLQIISKNIKYQQKQF
jgi:hypothetical protein